MPIFFLAARNSQFNAQKGFYVIAKYTRLGYGCRGGCRGADSIVALLTILALPGRTIATNFWLKAQGV